MSPRKYPATASLANLLTSLRGKAGFSRAQLATVLDCDARTIGYWESGKVPVKRLVIRFLEDVIARKAYASERDPSAAFTFVDLFAGIGGMRLGFEAAGGQCLFTSEWDKYSQRTYRANFGDTHEVFGDITAADPDYDVIPAHDVLVAGFPCQPFSIAGVSKKNALGRPHGFDCETQGTLFFNLERILAKRRPRAFLLENVKNLQNHDGGLTYRVIMRALQKLGYRVEPKVVDARCFVPQHRERIFLVGFREEDKVNFSWDDVDFPPRSKEPRLGSILHPENGSEPAEPRFLDNRGRVLPKYTLTDHLWKYLRDYATKHQAMGNGFGFGLVDRDDVARTLSARYFKDGSEILVRQARGNPRRLTPRECARLMGFDRGPRRFRLPDDVSDTQLYRQFGNAVVVPVVEAIARAMKPYIVGEELSGPSRRRQLALVI
jgi:DNA (cytosine-5)-methyltransferase 1